LAVMAIITGVGFALVLRTATETRIHENFREANAAFYAAQGGLEEVRGRMGPAVVPFARIPAPADVDTATYIVLDDTINPLDPDCSLDGISCYDPDAQENPHDVTMVPSIQSAGAVRYAWVKVALATQKRLNRNLLNPGYLSGLDDTIPIVWDGLKNMQLEGQGPGSPVLVFTALAILPNGGSRIVQEVGTWGNLPFLPGALVLNGPSPVFIPGSAAKFKISGVDTGTKGMSRPAIGVIRDEDVAPLQAAAEPPENYPGSGSLLPPPAAVANVQSLLNPAYQSVAGLQAIVLGVKAAASPANMYTGHTEHIDNWGTVADPVINVVDGDLVYSGNFDGAGILLVTGRIHIEGDPIYRGIILGIGEGRMTIDTTGTSATGQIHGTIFLANIYGALSGAATGLGSPVFEIVGGGNNGIQLNTDYTFPTGPNGGYLPLKRLSFTY